MEWELRRGSSLLGCRGTNYTLEVAKELSPEACLGMPQDGMVRCICLGRGKNVSKGVEVHENWHVWELYGLRCCCAYMPRGGQGGEVVVVA